MTDASKSELERATAELADGKPLDWDRLESVLAARDLQALRILEEARLGSPDPRPLENGFEIRGELG
jgi:hypothetical protein